MTIPANAVTTAPSREAVPSSVGSRRSASLPGEPATAIQPGKKAEPGQAQERAALAEINQTLRMASIGVQFEFDREADTMVVKVVDVESGELIRQMPSEEVVRISRALGRLQGLLVQQTA
ncbi:MAG: flagellar protein FlaG [Polaromonas sp.]|uniref:flagellar protein FlaG n=1 Tax=Polaromonas sp. TaxID=1869339 RepID=UPI002717C4F4|nr:flagellar protein FlaG [Polaromonas sp.]MDO9116268.1 flagellar protein FlaG [Polaromonas sp.]MDP1886211.1 flagellar protein FlaG [Polaromonas sp.]